MSSQNYLTPDQAAMAAFLAQQKAGYSKHDSAVVVPGSAATTVSAQNSHPATPSAGSSGTGWNAALVNMINRIWPNVK